MHVPLFLNSNTNLLAFHICIRHFKSRIPTTPNLFRITTSLGIRKTSCVLWEAKSGRASTPAADSHARAGLLLPVCYVIGEAMINKSALANQCLSSRNLDLECVFISCNRPESTAEGGFRLPVQRYPHPSLPFLELPFPLPLPLVYACPT
jgi:hypothetical protein